jgi:pimeloyl-ACP methyl ester carboxylesterase
MHRSRVVDGFQLAYDRFGLVELDGAPGSMGAARAARAAVVLLHGWPGDRTDYRLVTPLLQAVDVVVPDLRGFGASDRRGDAPSDAYGAAGQARSVAGLIEELGLRRPVVAGYDIGSRVAQALARARPELVGALAVSPPLPGIGERILAPAPQAEFWYQAFHQLGLAERLLDGQPGPVRDYLRHFWTHWSGPGFELAEDDLDHLVSAYAAPGAFTASIGWYRAGSGSVAASAAERAPEPADRIATPTTVLWPEHDPLFPPAWSDRLDRFFSAVRLRSAPGAGHFTPLECPSLFAAAVTTALADTGLNASP